MNAIRIMTVVGVIAAVAAYAGENWYQHRGPRQDGVTAVDKLPLTWSETENMRWKMELPGPGTSSPVVWGDRVFVTAFSGYSIDKKNPNAEDTSKLQLHVACFHARTGKQLWQKAFTPKNKVFPAATSPMKLHGYATNTPAVDADAVYAAFGNAGFWALTHDGDVLWESSLGKETHRWGSGASLVLWKDRVIANADIESHALIAFDRKTGKEAWRTTEGFPQGDKKPWWGGYSWGTPVIVQTASRPELVLLTPGRINAFDPDTGKLLWHEKSVGNYAMSTVIAHDGIIYAVMGSSHHPVTSIAYKAGEADGKRELWRLENTGVATSTPACVDGLIYWAGFHGGMRPNTPRGFCCLDPKKQELLYKVIPEDDVLRCSNSKGIYACALAAPGRIYYVSQTNGAYVVARDKEFRILAHNKIAGDDSCFNATPVPLADGGLLLRSDKAIYCIGQ